MKLAALALLAALAAQAPAVPAWPDTPAARVAALALVQTLNAEILGSASATATLERWCRDHRLAADPRVVADVAQGPVIPATPEQRDRLMVTAADSVLASLSPEERRPFRLRLNRVAVAIAGGLRQNVHVTDKVEAVHDYLARAEGVVTVKAVQRYLKRHGLATYEDAAALLLARKCKQGLLERVGRGRYRVNRHHPVVAGREIGPGE